LLEKYGQHRVGVAGGWADSRTHQRELGTRLFMQGMATLGLQVANVAATDLMLGPAVVAALQESLSTTFVSANTLVAGKPLFAPYVVVEKHVGGQPVRVGIVGVTGTSRAAQETWPDSLQLEFTDPIQAARAALDSLRSQTDIRVLLAHLPVQALENYIEEEINGYDLLICGTGDLREYTPVGKTPAVLAPGTSGKQLAWVNLRHGAAGDTEVIAGNVLNLSEKIEDEPAAKRMVERFATILVEDRRRATQEPTATSVPASTQVP
jgi:2',3'-cyclic-nucleotide 2'-phosphodiesterase (5'-nucleotidase family)